MTTQGGRQLDELLAKLEERQQGNEATRQQGNEATRQQGPDAIDLVLGSPPRVTQTQSLRDHETVRKFREEMVAGVIQVDTAMEFLRLILAVV
jgi:hypothetical protein